jgi:hypothetical protein
VFSKAIGLNCNPFHFIEFIEFNFIADAVVPQADYSPDHPCHFEHYLGSWPFLMIRAGVAK